MHAETAFLSLLIRVEKKYMHGDTFFELKSSLSVLSHKCKGKRKEMVLSFRLTSRSHIVCCVRTHNEQVVAFI